LYNQTIASVPTISVPMILTGQGVEGLAPGAPCAWPAWQRLSRNATNTNGRYCPCFSFRVMCAHLQSPLARSTPNAGPQPRLAAGARHEQRLPGVGCRPMLDGRPEAALLVRAERHST
jgi:hypothetical protein